MSGKERGAGSRRTDLKIEQSTPRRRWNVRPCYYFRPCQSRHGDPLRLEKVDGTRLREPRIGFIPLIGEKQISHLQNLSVTKDTKHGLSKDSLEEGRNNWTLNPSHKEFHVGSTCTVYGSSLSVPVSFLKRGHLFPVIILQTGPRSLHPSGFPEGSGRHPLPRPGPSSLRTTIPTKKVVPTPLRDPF